MKKEMQFLDVLFAFGNVGVLLIGLCVIDDGKVPTVGGIMAAGAVMSCLRIALEGCLVRFPLWLDWMFALFFLFCLYEGGCWCMYAGETFGLGVIEISVSVYAAGRILRNIWI